MESILELVVTSMVVALAQAHSHKKLTGFSQTAENCHERSSQAPGVGLGRNCRSLSKATEHEVALLNLRCSRNYASEHLRPDFTLHMQPDAIFVRK